MTRSFDDLAYATAIGKGVRQDDGCEHQEQSGEADVGELLHDEYNYDVTDVNRVKEIIRLANIK